MILDILPPIRTEGYTFSDIDLLIKKTYDVMSTKNQILREEVKYFTNLLNHKYLHKKKRTRKFYI